MSSDLRNLAIVHEVIRDCRKYRNLKPLISTYQELYDEIKDHMEDEGKDGWVPFPRNKDQSNNS